jgi:peptide/nickel transport system substrate-binding protein
VVFHNGEPFNAEAVRATVERVLDPNQKSPNRANIAEIVRVEVLDEATVNIVTQKPYAPLLNRLLDFAMLPPRYTAEKGNQGAALRPVGTGPFRFVELVKDDHLIVEAFDRHWRGAPRIRRIVFKPIPEPFTRAAALRNGEVDLVTTLPPNLARELDRVPGIKVHRTPSTWIIYLGLNALKKPLSDVRVRQALNYATDVDALVKNVMDGNGRRLEGPLTPQMFGYDAGVRGYAPDSGKARKLLAEAGYPDGLEIVLEAPAGRYQGDKEIAEALGGQWQKAGFKPKVRWRSGAPTSSGISASNSRTPICSASVGRCRTATSSTTSCRRRGAASTTRTTRSTCSWIRGGRPWTPPSGARSTPISAAPWSRTATWVYLMQQVDIYAARDRLTWTPRADQWLLFHEAVLK